MVRIVHMSQNMFATQLYLKIAGLYPSGMVKQVAPRSSQPWCKNAVTAWHGVSRDHGEDVEDSSSWSMSGFVWCFNNRQERDREILLFVYILCRQVQSTVKDKDVRWWINASYCQTFSRVGTWGIWDDHRQNMDWAYRMDSSAMVLIRTVYQWC